MTSARSAAKLEEVSAWLRDYAATRINSVLMDERRCVPPHVALDFGNHGLFGMSVSEELGGLGLTIADGIELNQRLSAIDLTLGTWVGIHNGLGVRPVERFAQPALKQQLVPLLASGRVLGGLAMTERAAGSNVRSIQTTARKDGDGWRVSGSKIWIGNGSWAGILNVFARRAKDEGSGMVAFCAAVDTPGLRVGPEALTMGMRAIVQNEVFLEDAFIPSERVLGRVDRGWDVAEDAFGMARLGIGANALGALRRATQIAMRFVRRRTIDTGRSLENTTTREAMSWLVCAVASFEELIATVVAEADRTGVAPTFLSAVCKALGSELLGTGADKALQLLGGRGYIEPNVLPQLVRDARVFRIFEGATEVIEAHLGSALMQGVLPMKTILTKDLRGPETLTLLEEALEQCRAARPGKDVESTQQLRAVAGRLAIWSALAAAAEQADTRGASALTQSARRWATTELKNQIGSALSRLREPVMLPPVALEEAVEAYAERIGDVEQRAAGADYALDPMLLKATR